MGLLHYFGAFLLCLIVAAAQTRQTTKFNEIESSSKSTVDSAINEKEVEKAGSEVSVAVKELKPKEREDSLEAVSTPATQKKQNSQSSGKFGQRSTKPKEEDVKTQASYRGDRYIPNPKVPSTQISPPVQNPGRTQITSRNAVIQGRHQNSDKQEQKRGGVRHPGANGKQMSYVEGRNFAEPAHLRPDSADFDDSREVLRPNIHRTPQTHRRPVSSEDYDASYHGSDDDCSNSKTRSISEEDQSDDRYPRQSKFSHRIQSPDNRPHQQTYVNDYNYRAQSTEDVRSLDSREKSEESPPSNSGEGRQHDREKKYYSKDPRDGKKPNKEVLQRQNGQYSYVEMSEGRGESVSEHKDSDSVSKSRSVSKSYSEPRQTQKVIYYKKQNSNQKAPSVHKATPYYNEEESLYEEHRTHEGVHRPVSQKNPPRGSLRGKVQGPENSPRKALTQHSNYRPVPEHSGPPQYERGHPQTHYSNDNARDHMDHHGPRHEHQHPVQDQQQQLPHQHHTHPREQRQHHTHPHEQRQHHTRPHEPRQHHDHPHEQRQHHAYPQDQRQHHAYPQEQRQHHPQTPEHHQHHQLTPEQHQHHPETQEQRQHHPQTYEHRQHHPQTHEQRQHYPHPHEQRQNHPYPYEQRQYHPYPNEQDQPHQHPRTQKAEPYAGPQAHSDSQNQRQDSIHQEQQQYNQPSPPVQHLRENKKQKVSPVYQSYDSRNPSAGTDSDAHNRNSPTSSYKRDYVVHPKNQYPGRGPAVQTRKNVEPAKSLPAEESDGAYYPAQDSEIRQHISSIHGSPRLPETAHERRPYVSVSYSESSYKDGSVEELRFSPEKSPAFDQRHAEFFKNEPSYDFAKNPIGGYFDKPPHDPVTVSVPEKSHGPSQEFEYAQKGKNQQDGFTSSEHNTNQNSDFGYQSGPPDERYQHHQHPRDDYETPPVEKDESPESLLSILRGHADISDKAKIIVAEPVPGKPGVLLADGKKAIVAGNMRGSNPSYPDSPSSSPDYSAPPQEVNQPRSAKPGHERNYGITQLIPGSFSALVNTDPKFLRRLPELMHSSREPSSRAPDSETYFSNSQESTSKEAEGRSNYEGKASPPSANLKNYGAGHGIIQDHGDGVRSVMYNIRPRDKSNHRLSVAPEESRTPSEKRSRVLSESEISEKLQYAKSTTVIKTVKPETKPVKANKKT